MKVTEVSKCLEKKLQIFGFEIPDLIATFVLLSVLNLVFGNHPYKLLFVWVPPMILAFVLRATKRGRPDNFLIHWIRYQVRPGVYCAFSSPNVSESLPIKKGVRHESNSSARR